jgi:hypothetical protein
MAASELEFLRVSACVVGLAQRCGPLSQFVSVGTAEKALRRTKTNQLYVSHHVNVFWRQARKVALVHHRVRFFYVLGELPRVKQWSGKAISI